MSERIWNVLVEGVTRMIPLGLGVTVPLTVLGFALAFVIAVAVALTQYAGVPVLRQMSRFYIWFFRGTPLLVQLFLIYYGLGQLGIKLPEFVAGFLTLGINEGAYCAESVRAAMEAVPAGQLEAGQCVGMTWWQTVRRIVLPQAMRTAFPPLGNSMIAMLKDTSLVSSITVAEMFMAAKRLVARTYEPFAVYLEVALFYLLFSTLLTWLERWGERRLNTYEYK